jgi:hypothetical protein
MCCAVISLAIYSSKIFFRKIVADMRDDALQGLAGDLHLPEDKNLDNSEFTLTNNSHQAMHVKDVMCALWSARLEGGTVLVDVGLKPSPHKVDLNSGGDAQEWSCHFTNYFGAAAPPVVCADVSWTVQFTLGADPKKIMTKGYRYTLKTGEVRWHRTGNNEPDLNCRVKGNS